MRKVRKYDTFCTFANLQICDLWTCVLPTFGSAATKMCYNLYLLVCKYVILYKALDWTGKDNIYSESNVKCLQWGASFIIFYFNNNYCKVLFIIFSHAFSLPYYEILLLEKKIACHSSYICTYYFYGPVRNVLDACRSITRASGRRLWPRNRYFFGPYEIASSRYSSAIRLGNAGLIHDQYYQTDPDAGMPMLDRGRWLEVKMPMPKKDT